MNETEFKESHCLWFIVYFRVLKLFTEFYQEFAKEICDIICNLLKEKLTSLLLHLIFLVELESSK